LPTAARTVNMIGMTTVAIAFNDEDRKFIEEALKSGRYVSESEVVAEALSELKVRESIRRCQIDDLRAKVQAGIEQADRGEFVEFTAEDVKVEGRKGLATQQAAR
jgi:antitoxin ParD1/3/4